MVLVPITRFIGTRFKGWKMDARVNADFLRNSTVNNINDLKMMIYFSYGTKLKLKGILQ